MAALFGRRIFKIRPKSGQRLIEFQKLAAVLSEIRPLSSQNLDALFSELAALFSELAALFSEFGRLVFRIGRFICKIRPLDFQNSAALFSESGRFMFRTCRFGLGIWPLCLQNLAASFFSMFWDFVDGLYQSRKKSFTIALLDPKLLNPKP